MKFKAIIKKELDLPELGIVKPGQVFEVKNKKLKHIFEDKTLFEKMGRKKKPVKKDVKAELVECPKKKKDGE